MSFPLATALLQAFEDDEWWGTEWAADISWKAVHRLNGGRIESGIPSVFVPDDYVAMFPVALR